MALLCFVMNNCDEDVIFAYWNDYVLFGLKNESINWFARRGVIREDV